jgi:outer membrane protein OmpA-like peptidoglycan-associated protein
MIRCLACCLLLCFSSQVKSQSLVTNGSFEERNICIEYHAKCAAEGWFRIPLGAVSNNNGTAGFFLGNQFETIVMDHTKLPGLMRSYIYTKLLCPLEKGRSYTFTAFFRTLDGAIDHVDVYLPDFEPYHFNRKINTAKQKLSINSSHATGRVQDKWKEYQVSFTARGDEKYLLIGNLSREEFKGKARKRMILYDIDNISLKGSDQDWNACPEIATNETALYLNDRRHSPGNYLDIPPPIPQIAKNEIPVPVKKADTPVVIAKTIPPPPVNDTLVVPDVLFKFDKSELNPVFAYRLDTLVDKIRGRSFQRIEVLGHTDSLGTDQYNQRLSQNRANTVKNYLAKKLNYPADNIHTKAFAASLPVSTNRTSAGRQKNRRVEIVLVRQ